MRWLLAMHVIAMVAWFAGLFYLPRLFVYHADSVDTISCDRFRVMEHRLYHYIMYPAALLTTASGLLLLSIDVQSYLSMRWMQLKLVLVLLLWGYHLICGYFIQCFKSNDPGVEPRLHSSRFFRIFNEIPTLLLIGIVCLVIVKPFV